jgi:hypothetical protein
MQLKEGVYLTLMSQVVSDLKLIENNYMGNYKYLDRIQYAFAIHRSYIDAYKLPADIMLPTRDCWRCESKIDLERVNFFLIDRTRKTSHSDNFSYDS